MESRRLTFNCSKCSYSTRRSYNLKRHLINEHKADRKTVDLVKTPYGSRHSGDGLFRRQPKAEPEDGLYTEEEFEKTMTTLRARFPNMKFRRYRSEIYAPVYSHHCRTVQFRKVDVLYASDKQRSRVYSSPPKRLVSATACIKLYSTSILTSSSSRGCQT